MRPADLIEPLGWLATAVFVASYRFNDQRTLRWTQAFAAVLWVGYGVARDALPVIVANVLVAVMAVYSSRRRKNELSPSREAPRSSTSLPCS
jgi:hypothetical protein